MARTKKSGGKAAHTARKSPYTRHTSASKKAPAKTARQVALEASMSTHKELATGTSKGAQIKIPADIESDLDYVPTSSKKNKKRLKSTPAKKQTPAKNVTQMTIDTAPDGPSETLGVTPSETSTNADAQESPTPKENPNPIEEVEERLRQRFVNVERPRKVDRGQLDQFEKESMRDKFFHVETIMSKITTKLTTKRNDTEGSSATTAEGHTCSHLPSSLDYTATRCGVGAKIIHYVCHHLVEHLHSSLESEDTVTETNFKDFSLIIASGAHRSHPIPLNIFKDDSTTLGDLFKSFPIIFDLLRDDAPELRDTSVNDSVPDTVVTNLHNQPVNEPSGSGSDTHDLGSLSIASSEHTNDTEDLHINDTEMVDSTSSAAEYIVVSGPSDTNVCTKSQAYIENVSATVSAISDDSTTLDADVEMNDSQPATQGPATTSKSSDKAIVADA